MLRQLLAKCASGGPGRPSSVRGGGLARAARRVGLALGVEIVVGTSLLAQGVAIHVNIPATRLDVIEEGALRATYPVAVGMRKYRTPTGEFRLTRITWNPWWYPPESEWARQDTVTPPGPTNPMGRVKLQFGSGVLYAHGTPVPSTVGRAASHGCLRMRNEDAVALARLVLSWDGMNVSDSSLDTLTRATSITRVLDVTVPIAVRIEYLVAEVRDSALELHPDLYRKRTGRVRTDALEALRAAGVDIARVDRRLLANLVRQSARKSVRRPIAELLRRDPTR